MVQLKYFGDDRDFFKYDLITFILKKSSLSNYVFIPMLTEHRNDNEGQKSSADKNDRSPELLQFMRGCPSKSLRHWENWISRFGFNRGQYILFSVEKWGHPLGASVSRAPAKNGVRSHIPTFP